MRARHIIFLTAFFAGLFVLFPGLFTPPV